MVETSTLVPHHSNPDPKGTRRTVTEEFLHPDEGDGEGAEVVVLKEWAG